VTHVTAAALEMGDIRERIDSRPPGNRISDE
jgi:hypothetical protein